MGEGEWGKALAGKVEGEKEWGSTCGRGYVAERSKQRQ